MRDLRPEHGGLYGHIGHAGRGFVLFITAEATKPGAVGGLLFLTPGDHAGRRDYIELGDSRYDAATDTITMSMARRPVTGAANVECGTFTLSRAANIGGGPAAFEATWQLRTGFSPQPPADGGTFEFVVR